MAFLPLFIVTYYILSKINPVFGKLSLVIGSMIFYIYGRWTVAVILGISTLINYGMAMMTSRHTPPKKNIVIYKYRF